MIESDPARADALARAIQPAGIAVTSISEGERALAKAKGSRPDLVVISAELRDMSGFSLCNRFRRTAGLADVRILLVPGEADGPATEAHRASRSPADDYLSPGSGPEELLEHVRNLLGLNGAMPAAEEMAAPIPLDHPVPTMPPPLPGQSQTAIPLQSVQVVAPPAPGPQPPALPRSTTRPIRIDPFAELAAEPRLPLGASLDEKLNFFRDRVKVKDDLLARVKVAWTELRDDLDGRDRETAGLRHIIDQAHQARAAAEAAQGTAVDELARLTAELESTAGAMARLSQESDGARQQAEERSQSLSEVLNDTLREREQAERDSAARLAEAEQRTGLLQEEIDHLAGTQEKSEARAVQAEQEVARLKAAAEAAAEAQAKELEELRKELVNEKEQRKVELARVASLDADFEAQREEAEVWAGRRRELETDLAAAQARRDELEEQATRISSREAELKGELEALQQGDAQMHEHVVELVAKLGPAEARVAELEAELESRSEEAAGLRSAREQARAEKEASERALREQLEQKARELADIQAKAARREKELADSTGKVQGGLAAQLQALQGQLAEKDVRLAAKQAEFTDSIQQLQDSFGVQVIDLRGQLEAREGELTELTEKLQEALSQVDAFQGELAAKGREERESGAQSDEAAALREQLGVKDREIATLTRKAKETTTQLTGVQQQLGDKNRELGALTKRFDEVEQASRGVGEAVRGGSSSEKALRVRAADLAAEVKALRERLAGKTGSNDEVQKLRAELEDQRAENEFLTQELSRNAEKIQELQDSLAEAEPLELETITDE